MKQTFLIFALAAICLQLAVSKKLKKKHRIIAGRPASIEEFPYQVSLERMGEHFCGGSILHERIILTAAHCTVHLKTMNRVPVRAMAVRVGTSISGRGGRLHNVRRVRRHEGYVDNAESDTHDLALILLSRPITFNDKAQRIGLSLSSPKPGAKGWVTGYGSQIQTNSRAMTNKRQLMAVELPVVSINTCKTKMKALGTAVADDMFCAGYTKGHRDACRGDSGGPFQIDGVLHGAVAWGIGCGREGLPGVYTDLKLYEKWLKRTTARLLRKTRSQEQDDKE